MHSASLQAIAAAFALTLAGAAFAQEITLKIHHPLPPTSTAHQKMLTPWCEQIAAKSQQRIKCQIYPAMQLGGAPPQLVDQVKDGVVDAIWTIPSYSAGRFPLIEVFELPFMMREAEGASKAVWDYVRLHAPNEFKDVKLLALHTHGGGLFHMVKKPIKQAADLRGAKVRAPTRQTTKMLAALGASPVGMPVPQVPEALSKGVIDGALLPYEVMPAIKAQELTKFHSEPHASQPKLHTSVFVFAMNKAKFEALPAELRKVIDQASGFELSAAWGRIFGAAESANRKLVPAQSINVIDAQEIERWRELTRGVADAWVQEMRAKGVDGAALIEQARALIAKHSG
jgi:TRAP-type transport system periplasmic protein